MLPRLHRALPLFGLTFVVVPTEFARSPQPVPAATMAVSASLSPGTISGLRGETRLLTLQADLTGSPGTQLGSYATSVTWDSTVVRLDSVRAGDFLMPTVNLVHAGELRLSTATATAGMSGAFSLVRMYFRFVNDTVGKSTAITPVFSEFNSITFADLMGELGVIGATATTAPHPVTLHFTPDSIGERVRFKPMFTLTADLSGASGVLLGSYAATITWDTLVARLDSVRAGDFGPVTWFQPNARELRVTAADPAGRGGAPFSLARLFFRFVNDTIGRSTSINLAPSEVSAAGTFANLLPGVVVRNGVGAIVGVLRGDVDQNDVISSLDAQAILQTVVGINLPATFRVTPNADANCSNTNQALDAQIVLNHVVGNDVSAFCVGTVK